MQTEVQLYYSSCIKQKKSPDNLEFAEIVSEILWWWCNNKLTLDLHFHPSIFGLFLIWNVFWYHSDVWEIPSYSSLCQDSLGKSELLKYRSKKLLRLLWWLTESGSFFDKDKFITSAVLQNLLCLSFSPFYNWFLHDFILYIISLSTGLKLGFMRTKYWSHGYHGSLV